MVRLMNTEPAGCRRAPTTLVRAARAAIAGWFGQPTRMASTRQP